MEKARCNTELYSNLRAPLNNVKPSNFWGSHHRLVTLYLIHQPTLLASISVAPWIGSHKLLELLHIGDALDILFLLEPFLDCRPVEVQSVTLADKRNVVIPDRSVHRRFGFAKHLANIFHAHQLSFEGCGCCFSRTVFSSASILSTRF